MENSGLAPRGANGQPAQSSRRLWHKLTYGPRKLRRAFYRLRRFIPGLRDRHIAESMVGPVGAWDELQAYQIRCLKTNGLLPQHHFLDVGCGPLQGGVPVIDYLERGHYVGVDQSVRNLSAGYGMVKAHELAGKNPRLLVSSDFGESELGARSFDFFWASQILYYFDEALLQTLFRTVAARMAPGGKFLGDIIGPGHPEFNRPEQSELLRTLKLHSVESLDRCAASAGLRARSLGEIIQFGYPKRLTLWTNVLIEVTRRE